MSRDVYILNADHSVTPVAMETWGRWFQNAERIVARTEFPDGGFVSTVFLGLDHSFDEDQPPLIFETMAFGRTGEELGQWRYSTWDEAVAGHKRVLAEMQERFIVGDATRHPLNRAIDI